MVHVHLLYRNHASVLSLHATQTSTPRPIFHISYTVRTRTYGTRTRSCSRMIHIYCTCTTCTDSADTRTSRSRTKHGYCTCTVLCTHSTDTVHMYYTLHATLTRTHISRLLCHVWYTYDTYTYCKLCYNQNSTNASC